MSDEAWFSGGMSKNILTLPQALHREIALNLVHSCANPTPCHD